MKTKPTRQDLIKKLIKDLETNPKGDSIFVVDKTLPSDTMKYTDEEGNILFVKVNMAGDKLDIIDYYVG